MTGKIIHLDRTHGWGFIESPEKPFTRIFFHWSGLVGDTLNFTELRKGMNVEFDLINYKDQGLRAIQIDVLEPYEEEKTARSGTDNS